MSLKLSSAAGCRPAGAHLPLHSDLALPDDSLLMMSSFLSYQRYSLSVLPPSLSLCSLSLSLSLSPCLFLYLSVLSVLSVLSLPPSVVVRADVSKDPWVMLGTH